MDLQSLKTDSADTVILRTCVDHSVLCCRPSSVYMTGDAFMSGMFGVKSKTDTRFAVSAGLEAANFGILHLSTVGDSVVRCTAADREVGMVAP